MSPKWRVLVSILCVVPALAQQPERYALHLLENGSVEISGRGVRGVFRPEFTVLRSETDPGLKSVLDHEEAFRVPAWKSGGSETMDLFAAGRSRVIAATKASQNSNSIEWQFPPDSLFQMEAGISLPDTRHDPVISFRFTPRQPGWYSIGYTGAPIMRSDAINSIWQPLVWQERRFPRLPFLSMEYMCSLPAALVSGGGHTFGVAADPEEVPFRLPTFENSRFGVAVRNQAGEAQPMIFAPVLGRPASKMEPGTIFSFRLRAVVQPDDWFAAFRHIAVDLYRFHDYRQNGPVSLNETLDNMIDFAMNDAYSGWVEDLKAFDYATDVPGSVKLVSAMHPLSLAIVRDDPEIYRRRALPMMEYMMSREKYLFSMAEAIKGQSASHLMKGPCAEVSELAGLFAMSRDRSPVFRHYAELLNSHPRKLNLDMVSEGGSWQNLLALYRTTGDPKLLALCKQRADRYIATRIETSQTDFSDVHVDAGGQFWTDFAPKWVDLLELYETTHEPRYLKAATQGAKEYSTYVWLQPQVPDKDVLVNPGGKTGMYYTRRIPHPQPIPAPEQKVPAWRLAQIGLTPEASTTYAGNPAVLLTHYAAYMLRLSRYTGDHFFHDIARSAVVGRYENFPGYDINGEYTTTYQRPDYPLRPWAELTYNNIYYNHVWPHIALLTDYLVSDAVVRSEGKIDFPSEYAQGYAYLQSKVYGDRPGEFYGDRNVYLWLPRALLNTSNPQVNYLSGYGNGNLYLALMNQSNSEVSTDIRLNPDVAPVDTSHAYRVRTWRANQTGPAAELLHGRVSVTVPAQGITALAIDGLAISTRFQQRYFDPGAAALSDGSFRTLTSPFGEVTGMLISMGRALGNGYVWLEATERELKEARLHYREAGEWKQITDAKYPYEFSFPVADADAEIEFYVEGIDLNNQSQRSATVRLTR